MLKLGLIAGVLLASITTVIAAISLTSAEVPPFVPPVQASIQPDTDGDPCPVEAEGKLSVDAECDLVIRLINNELSEERTFTIHESGTAGGLDQSTFSPGTSTLGDCPCEFKVPASSSAVYLLRIIPDDLVDGYRTSRIRVKSGLTLAGFKLRFADVEAKPEPPTDPQTPAPEPETEPVNKGSLTATITPDTGGTPCTDSLNTGESCDLVVTVTNTTAKAKTFSIHDTASDAAFGPSTLTPGSNTLADCPCEFTVAAGETSMINLRMTPDPGRTSDGGSRLKVRKDSRGEKLADYALDYVYVAPQPPVETKRGSKVDVTAVIESHPNGTPCSSTIYSNESCDLRITVTNNTSKDRRFTVDFNDPLRAFGYSWVSQSPTYMVQYGRIDRSSSGDGSYLKYCPCFFDVVANSSQLVHIKVEPSANYAPGAKVRFKVLLGVGGRKLDQFMTKVEHPTGVPVVYSPRSIGYQAMYTLLNLIGAESLSYHKANVAYYDFREYYHDNNTLYVSCVSNSTPCSFQTLRHFLDRHPCNDQANYFRKSYHAEPDTPAWADLTETYDRACADDGRDERLQILIDYYSQ